MWRVGTACSGTDSVVKVLEHIGRSSGLITYRQCIADGSDQTGETFQGVLGYTRRFRLVEAHLRVRRASRAPCRIGATPCVLPQPRLHWLRQQRVLDARELDALQGIWPRDFRPSSHGASQSSGHGC